MNSVLFTLDTETPIIRARFEAMMQHSIDVQTDDTEMSLLNVKVFRAGSDGQPAISPETAPKTSRGGAKGLKRP
ncbi:MAG: hypothetical protein ACOYNL_04330 [Rickettsiales bacterium]